MNTEREAESEGTAKGPENSILHIVGKNQFNNDILAGFLSVHTGIERSHLYSCRFTGELKLPSDKTNLILMDYTCLSELNVEEVSCLEQTAHAANCRLILFQVKPERKIEHLLFRKGVRGILYNDQPLSLYPKALLSILSGELWYPRRILEQLFLQIDLPPFIPGKVWHILTGRQKEILRMLAAGKTNRQIAEKLCLSPHTIKTHIYNIYKKLAVSNRLEAYMKIAEVLPRDN